MKRVLLVAVAPLLLAACEAGSYRGSWASSSCDACARPRSYAPADGYSYAPPSPVPYPSSSLAPPPRQEARIAAGEIDDNEKFSDYLAYVAAYPHRDVPKVDVRDAHVLTILDDGGWTVPDAAVQFFDQGREVYRAHADASGRVLFPPLAVGVAPTSSVEVFANGTRSSVDPRNGFARVGRRGVAPEVRNLDVALCLDTTGSMDDEIDRLKSTLREVTERIARLEPRLRARYALVVYRDIGDEYVNRVFDFTPDVDEAVRQLERVRAEGGGDYPEAVNEALEASVDRLSWSPEGAVRMLFLIGDAPPHLERGKPYTQTLRRAVERGIKIVSVAASGLDDKGEFVWRQLAQLSLGRFVFISYGGGTEHHVGPYVENDLDDILVHAVGTELEALGRRGPPAAPPPRIGQGRAPDDFMTYDGRWR